MTEDVRQKNFSAPREDAGVVTYIQPHLILRGVIGLLALTRSTFWFQLDGFIKRWCSTPGSRSYASEGLA
jgi:hypothetical protein